MTRLTSETAFNVIPQKYIIPHISMIIIITTMQIITAEKKSNPRRMKVITNMAARHRPMLKRVSCTTVRYCS